MFTIPLQNNCINALLSGGFSSKKIYHIFGVEGAGKSTICIDLAKRVALSGFKTLYVNSSHAFNIKRLEQIAGESFQEVSKLIFVQNPNSFSEQDKIINKLENFITDKFRLIVLDDIISLSLDKNNTKLKPIVKNRMISRELAILKNITKIFDVIVVVTNQGTSVRADDEITNPYLESVTTFYSDFDLEIKNTADSSLSKRILTKIKPSELSKKEQCEFNLTNSGIT